DVVLEDDEQEDEGPAQHVVEEHVDRVDLELRRQEVEAVHHRQADQHRHGPGAADQVDARVDADREQDDVDAILPAEAEDQILHAVVTAVATASTSRIAPTSCTRSRRAPRATASATAAAVPYSRSPTPAPPSSAPRNPLPDTPTSTASPRAGSTSRWASSARLCATVLPKPMPGSITIAPRATPASRAAAARRARNAATSETTSRYAGLRCMVAGRPRMCIRTTGTPAR